MSLYGKPVIPVHYRHAQHFKLLTEPQRQEYYQKLLNGDKTVIDALAESYAGLAQLIACQYARCQHTKAYIDDMASEGILIITECLNNIAEGKCKPENLSTYLSRWIHCRISRWTKKQFRKCATLDNKIKIESLAERTARAKEALSKLATTEIQQEIVKLRLEGRTYNQIAEQTGYSRSWVGSQISEMRERYENLV